MDTGSGDDFVDLFFIDIGINNYPNIPATYIGEEGIGRITLSLMIRCPEIHYGPDCATFCMERDDELGHYTCDREGDIVCREGYQDPSTICTNCVPSEGCCKLAASAQ